MDVARGKPATADAVLAAYSPQQAVDGDYMTLWSPIDDTPGHWLMVDLEDMYQLTCAQVIWEANVPVKYLLQASADAEHWTTVVDRSTRRLTHESVVDEFPDINTVFADRILAVAAYRHVRLTLLDAAGAAGRLRALKVFGTPFDAA
jgi:hypothetical protein